MTSSNGAVLPCTPFAAVGCRIDEVMASSRSVDTWVVDISIPHERGHLEQQQRACRAGEDTFVIDHDRGRQHVAEITGNAEFPIVSIAREPARLERAQHRLYCLLRRVDLEKVHPCLEIDGLEAVG